MTVVILSMNDMEVYPAMHFLAAEIARQGIPTHVICNATRHSFVPMDPRIEFHRIENFSPESFLGKIPYVRSGGHKLFSLLQQVKPKLVIGHQQYAVSALIYSIATLQRCKAALYFSDYDRNRPYTRIAGFLASGISAYIDICDIRLEWRRMDWPKMRGHSFVMRQAPSRQTDFSHVEHRNPLKIALTGSSLMLKMDQERLSKFINRLCDRKVSLDWYFPGTEDVRDKARGLSHHPLYTVCDPLPKAALMEALGTYDVGLFWAPIADADLSQSWDRSVFLSAASNKIGEYIAAGLIVAHTGNLGLSYLPAEVCAIFDPTDPTAGADELVDQLEDRDLVERKRQAALQYHFDEMNFEVQAAPFVRYVVDTLNSPSTSVAERL